MDLFRGTFARDTLSDTYVPLLGFTWCVLSVLSTFTNVVGIVFISRIIYVLVWWIFAEQPTHDHESLRRCKK